MSSFFGKKVIILGICGIIAEFNPLHNGHKYLIERAKADGNTVVTVISGNFVQRGDTAIIPKFKRAEMALLCGADIVAELPTPWAMSTAQNFAFGAISQLLCFGIDSLYFGSESANCEELTRIADLLLSDEFKERISNNSISGETFAKHRSDIINQLLGHESDVLNSPNDTLAVEYICAAKRLGANIKFVPIKRVGPGHNDMVSTLQFSNATLIRQAMYNSDFDSISHFIPEECKNTLLSSPLSNISRLDKAIISRLKLTSKEELSKTPDVSEGIDNLLYNQVRDAVDYESLLNSIKSKRYTLARVRRLVLSAFLGIDNRYFGTQPPYVRVIGFKKDALKFDNTVKPVITKVAQIQALDESARALFDKENKINEIYALSLERPEDFINECTERIIIK